MGDKTKIAWADATWGPITGCTPASVGCRNCYAASMVKRFPQLHGIDENLVGFGNEIESQFSPAPFWMPRFHPDRLDQPLRWRKPRRIFVCSLGDLFHEDVKEEWIDRVMAVVALAPRHTFMVLTKRPERMRKYFAAGERSILTRIGNAWNEMGGDLAGTGRTALDVWPWKCLHLGVTAENQEMADARIPILLQTPAARRFVSIEPCLELPDIAPYLRCEGCGYSRADMRFHGDHRLCKHPTPVLDQVIVGCESGPRRRPMHLDWARSVVEQCKAAEVPCFVKQLSINGRVSKDPADWPEELRGREAGKPVIV